MSNIQVGDICWICKFSFNDPKSIKNLGKTVVVVSQSQFSREILFDVKSVDGSLSGQGIDGAIRVSPDWLLKKKDGGNYNVSFGFPPKGNLGASVALC